MIAPPPRAVIGRGGALDWTTSTQSRPTATGCGFRPRGPLPARDCRAAEGGGQGAGLWNLFLPGLKDDEPGTRLTNCEYAPLAEIMGRIPWASEVFNCSAPDTGNMEMLHLFATPEQRETG
jgi:hypothetical protein